MNKSEKFRGVEHIFKGILEEKLDAEATTSENLESLQADFERLGIHIDPSCNIATSTLKKLVRFINAILAPSRKVSPEFEALFGGVEVEVNESGKRFDDDIIRSKEEKDFNIKIGADVVIGENVELGTSISIGEQSTIGNGVYILTGALIGSRCTVGDFVYVNYDCSIGDNSEIVDRTTLCPQTEVPPNSRVIQEATGNQMVKIEKIIKSV